VTEAEWNACIDPRPMIGFLRDKLSNRKARLFAAACCRLASHLFGDDGSKRAVEVAERFADGLASDDERSGAWGEITSLSERSRDASWWADSAAETAVTGQWGLQDSWYKGAAVAAREVCMAVPESLPAQLAFFRCIAGNPFRPVSLNPAWLAWDDGTVPKLAQTIYDARRFADLPILADALEDAGCTDAEILGHLRGPGSHVRGCWVVDLLLGKE
jgi:hypothetical protein